MVKETTATGKTVEAAVAAALETLGKTAEQVDVEVLEEGKKGLFGIGAIDAKVRVSLKETPALRAVNMLEKLIENMHLDAEVVIESENEEEALIRIDGENLGVLIGRRGDVLDSVQYLATLSANLGRPGYYRISVDAQGYRAKRAETIRGIARRMAEKVLRFNRAFQLDPMSAYERRIVHSECQSISGVTTRSVGEGADRRVVISPDKK
ncbi:MAG: Jag N-terminal domain-containing protein [Clostridia bacterium]|nr:Jag N-terminal domain-containing protein [Clostridia bacterium]